MSDDLKYVVAKLDGTPFHWCDFCVGWADVPIRFRRERDARHAVEFLKEKFGAATWILDVVDAPLSNMPERVPTFVDALDTLLALWIAESQMADEGS